jgi:hypothetical protein
MKPITKINKITILLWALTLIPMLIVLATEANKTVLIGYMRIVDFIDLSVIAPFFLAITLAIHSVIFSDKLSSRSSWVSLVLIGILLYGHSMHMTANSINTYSTEIKNYRDIIPNDTYALIYFLDEQLGHWLLYVGLFGLLGMWTWSCDIESSKLGSLLICGGLFGISYGIVFIESSQVRLAPIFVIWMLGCAFFTARKRNQLFLNLMKASPMFQFTTIAAIGILIGISVYFLITGGFVEPSKYGL